MKPTRLLALTLLLCACAAPERRGDALVDIHLVAEPASVGTAALTVSVVDEAWRPLNGAQVAVSAVPPGGELSDPAAASGVGAGRYTVDSFALDRAGEWSFTVRVDLSGGRWAEVDVPIEVLAAPTG